jgi:hypothetical protein
LVEVYQRFRGPCCLHHQGDIMRLDTHYYYIVCECIAKVSSPVSFLSLSTS